VLTHPNANCVECFRLWHDWRHIVFRNSWRGFVFVMYVYVCVCVCVCVCAACELAKYNLHCNGSTRVAVSQQSIGWHVTRITERSLVWYCWLCMHQLRIKGMIQRTAFTGIRACIRSVREVPHENVLRRFQL